MLENEVEKGENAVSQHFLLFTQCFQKPLPILPWLRVVWQLVTCTNHMENNGVSQDLMLFKKI